MIVNSISLADFRNYEYQSLSFSEGINIFYGENAQGKTNLLEAISMCSVTKSFRGSRDRDMIRFGREEAHLKLNGERNGVPFRIDLHLKRNRPKGIAVNSVPIRRISELLGTLYVVVFSPEDLQMVKNGPGERRRLLDTMLCQLDRVYLKALSDYQRCLDQRNTLLREAAFRPDVLETLDVWDAQLLSCGKQVIDMRAAFAEEIAPHIRTIHHRISGGKEQLDVSYEPNAEAAELESVIRQAREADCRGRMTTRGPHRDDLKFLVRRTEEGGDARAVDIRTFGSQGQQRTASLSVKLSEIEVIRERVHDTPVLLLDDVLSELDEGRQTSLLDGISGAQTFITCTGLDDFVKRRFHMDRVFRIAGNKAVLEDGKEQIPD